MGKMVRLFCVLSSAAVVTLASTGARATDPRHVALAQVNINVVPFASLQFTTSNTLELDVPPSKSTVNTSGSVGFLVTGNAEATVTAAPDQFVNIPGTDGGWMGKAVKGSDVLGYDIQLTFPSNSIVGSPKAIATLARYEQGPTIPALSANLQLTGEHRLGTIDLLASEAWTPDGALPLPGLYVGQIVLTVTASNF